MMNTQTGAFNCQTALESKRSDASAEMIAEKKVFHGQNTGIAGLK